MHVTVNGEARVVAEGMSILELLDELGLEKEATVVERNGDILDRAAYGATILAHDDVIELVRFVGGG